MAEPFLTWSNLVGHSLGNALAFPQFAWGGDAHTDYITTVLHHDKPGKWWWIHIKLLDQVPSLGQDGGQHFGDLLAGLVLCKLSNFLVQVSYF